MDDPDADRRRARPRMSIGGIASLVGIAMTFAGVIHYADVLIAKLDTVAEQVTALGNVKNDIGKLQARMDGLEGWFRYVVAKETAPQPKVGP